MIKIKEISKRTHKTSTFGGIKKNIMATKIKKKAIWKDRW